MHTSTWTIACDKLSIRRRASSTASSVSATRRNALDSTDGWPRFYRAGQFRANGGSLEASDERAADSPKTRVGPTLRTPNTDGMPHRTSAYRILRDPCRLRVPDLVCEGAGLVM